ncbi:hypothetical protein [Anaerotignum propionicum]|jgi:hypothetical protein|uniref:HTH cro/C1-type domain-containing protein n=1 Tax=Anaerotignum propionicum DSM 1682 TaxID=991789 RepID=A0A0X8VAS9_ANAPI|nr:hypothetical protein [Anaerotignum propionicum]AMJ40533.1 hypothetical protein CPRO_09340 [Anaerotignum propionicum DSM 1682]MEA5057093.1 hypothetical protein [Anaerotignum propionicum]SHE39615.1 hypothetical protein SAMN02745151_00550 [[Clostridium] propionicum DSM 1682] [Anaerotignum propionicum DSM 1682]
MVDANKLKEKIQKKGLTEARTAEKLGMNNHVFHDKLNGIGKCFTIKEVDKLVQILRLEGNDAERIFFAK